MPLTSSGSVPSTIRRIPFFINSSSNVPATSSKARSPSFLATLDNSIILLIVSAGSSLGSLNAVPTLFKLLIESFKVYDVTSDDNEPPNVIINDGKSMKLSVSADAPPLCIIPKIVIASPTTNPIIVAISIAYTVHSLYFIYLKRKFSACIQ